MLCVEILTDIFSSAQNKLEGTVWMDVDDAKVFKILDLDDIEKTFSAYQRQQVLSMMQLTCPTHHMSSSSCREGGWLGAQLACIFKNCSCLASFEFSSTVGEMRRSDNLQKIQKKGETAGRVLRVH